MRRHLDFACDVCLQIKRLKELIKILHQWWNNLPVWVLRNLKINQFSFRSTHLLQGTVHRCQKIQVQLCLLAQSSGWWMAIVLGKPLTEFIKKKDLKCYSNIWTFVTKEIRLEEMSKWFLTEQ